MEQLIADVGAIFGFAGELVRENLFAGFLIRGRCDVDESLFNGMLHEVPGNFA
jgi:hypothetical protein